MHRSPRRRLYTLWRTLSRNLSGHRRGARSRDAAEDERVAEAAAVLGQVRPDRAGAGGGVEAGGRRAVGLDHAGLRVAPRPPEAVATPGHISIAYSGGSSAT